MSRALGPTLALVGVVLALSGALADLKPSDQSAAAVVSRFVDAFNRHDLSTSASFVADDVREIFPDGNSIIGKAAFQERIAFEFAAQPTVTIILNRLVGDDRTAVAELTYVPDPRIRPLASQYVYVFAVAGGKISMITVYTRSAEAQKASAKALATPSPVPTK